MKDQSDLSRFIELDTGPSPEAELRGDFNRAVKAIGKMLTLPHLKRMTFYGHLNPFIEQIIEDNEAKRDIIAIVSRHPPTPVR